LLARSHRRPGFATGWSTKYETIDDSKVLASVGTLLRLYPRYIQAIEFYLTKAGL
jgi:hypothetical protein